MRELRRIVLLVGALSRGASAGGGRAIQAPRVAVFGGTGFIGSRVCQVLAEHCNVLSISRKVGPPLWANGMSWTQDVEWLSADADMIESFRLGRVSACVDCVGTDPSSNRYDSDASRRSAEPDDERVTRQIARIAKEAGASRFVYLSISSEYHEAFGGAFEGFVNAKLKAEQAVRETFNDDQIVVIAPTSASVPGPLSTAKTNLLSSPLIISAVALTQWFNRAGWRGEDYALRVATTPPLAVEVVARAAAAGALGASEAIPGAPALELGFNDEARYAAMSRGYASSKVEFRDANDEVARIAEQAGNSEVLAAAAASYSAKGIH